MAVYSNLEKGVAKMNIRKSTTLNIVFSLLLQFVTIASGLVVPRLILGTFGSNVNGLVSSITQFLNYITIIEGGLGSVILAALYRAIADNNEEKVSSVVSASRVFFNQIGIIYLGYSVVLSLVYPLIVETKLTHVEISLLVLVIAFSAFVQYMFSATYRLFLIAEQRGFVTSIVHIIILCINLVNVVVAVHICPNIHIVKLVQGVTFILQPIVFNNYIDKRFNINKYCEPDREAISQRWDGFGQNLAFFVHSNTDILILTFFTSLETVSVYSVYMMLIKAVNQLVSSLSSGFSPTIGRILADNDTEKSNAVFDLYEIGMWSVAIVVFCSCAILIVPFVVIYTKGMTDANYVQPVFGTIMSMAEMVYCIRNPYIDVIYGAGHFRPTSKYAYVEAIINIVLSVILANKFGLVGVAIGTYASMLYRMIASVIYLSKNILYRPIGIFIKKAIVLSVSGIVGSTIAQTIILEPKYSYSIWIIDAVMVVIVMSIVVLFFLFLFQRGDMGRFGSVVREKLKKQT